MPEPRKEARVVTSMGHNGDLALRSHSRNRVWQANPRDSAEKGKHLRRTGRRDSTGSGTDRQQPQGPGGSTTDQRSMKHPGHCLTFNSSIYYSLSHAWPVSF